MQFDLGRSMAILERTPGVLAALVGGLSGDWTQPDYGPGTWSAHQIVGHLIFGERTDWIPRTRHLIEHGEAVPFEPFDRTGHEPICAQHSLDELLTIFSAERARNIEALRSLQLSRTDLEKTGTHPAFGRVTLAQLLATWVAHDLHHIAQICKAMARQYKDEVGPWAEYIAIVSAPLRT